MKTNPQAFLHAHGLSVTPDALHRMMREAVARLYRTLTVADPRSELPAEEARLLEEGGFDLAALHSSDDDPLALTVAEMAALLETSLTTTEAAGRLGVDASRIRQRLTSEPSTLYGVRLDDGWRLPLFQFASPGEGEIRAGDGLLPGWAQVAAAVPEGLHPVALQRWLVTPNAELTPRGLELEGPVSPKDWLRLGQGPEAVADLVRQL